MKTSTWSDRHFALLALHNKHAVVNVRPVVSELTTTGGKTRAIGDILLGGRHRAHVLSDFLDGVFYNNDILNFS